MTAVRPIRTMLLLAMLVAAFLAAAGRAGADNGIPSQQTEAETAAPACGTENVNTLSAVECAGITIAPSLDPEATSGDALLRFAAVRRANAVFPANCRLHVEVVVYAATDWVRLGQALARDPSVCADYFISTPPLAADKTALRCLQDDLIRALGPRFHPMAEFHFAGWDAWAKRNGKTLFDAGVEFRRRMAACGYDPTADESWALNEMHSGVRRNNGRSRPNMIQLLKALYEGDGTIPKSKGLVFVIGFGQGSTTVSDYKPQMEEWLQDAAFWAGMDDYVRFFAQEVYPDVRNWGVADASRHARTERLTEYLQHPLILAEAGPEPVATARDFLRRTYLPLANAAWPWDFGFGFTKVSVDQMMKFVSEQTYSVRHFAGSHPQGAPEGRIGFAWAPNNTCRNPNPPPVNVSCIDPRVFAELTGLILERLASSIHHAYEEGAGAPPGACGPPGEHVWCEADIAGATFTDLWSIFTVWGVLR